MGKRIFINEPLGLGYSSSNVWIEIDLRTYGTTREELIMNAKISEVNNTKETLKSYPLDDSTDGIYDAAASLIDRRLYEVSQTEQRLAQ